MNICGITIKYLPVYLRFFHIYALYPQFPHNDSLTELPFSFKILSTPFSSELVRTCLFKIKPSEDPEAKPFSSVQFSRSVMSYSL